MASDLVKRLRLCASESEAGRNFADTPCACREAADEIERLSKGDGGEAFQDRVQPWMMECFGAEISTDVLERNDRFIEESLELVQANGYGADRAHALVDYVFGRPVGEPVQEVGGVMVTLAALCLAAGLDMHEAGETELARVWTKVEQIRAKQAAKPTGSALPIALSATPPAVPEGMVREQIRSEIINTPETADFMAGVPIEAAHQRERWGADRDAGKSPFDWFWLVGYLAQKAASSAVAGDAEKARHHTISTAAALANWHAALSGADTRMRPGIEPPAMIAASSPFMGEDR